MIMMRKGKCFFKIVIFMIFVFGFVVRVDVFLYYKVKMYLILRNLFLFLIMRFWIIKYSYIK